MSVTHSQLARAAVLVRRLHDGGRPVQSMLAELGAIVPARCVCYHELEPHTRRNIGFRSSDPGLPHDWDDAEWRATFWRLYPQMAPLRYLCDGGGTRRDDVVTLSDFTGQRDLLRTGLYQDYLRPLGHRYAIVIPLPRLPGRARGLTFFRWDRDFAEAERDLLTLLRPHLVAADRAARGRDAAARLTVRQWQVVRCVAAGQSTTQVAATMCVSTATVRKHLENIYARLGVTSRAAMLGRVFASDPDRCGPPR